MMNNKVKKKVAYASPVVKVAKFNVEKGYAGSIPAPASTSGTFSAGGWAPYGGN